MLIHLWTTRFTTPTSKFSVRLWWNQKPLCSLQLKARALSVPGLSVYRAWENPNERCKKKNFSPFLCLLLSPDRNTCGRRLRRHLCSFLLLHSFSLCFQRSKVSLHCIAVEFMPSNHRILLLRTLDLAIPTPLRHASVLF